MKRYWILTGAMLALFLASFGLMEALNVSFLKDPSAWMNRQGGMAWAPPCSDSR